MDDLLRKRDSGYRGAETETEKQIGRQIGKERHRLWDQGMKTLKYVTHS